MKLMAGLIRRGREAREVMADPGSAFADVGATIPVPAAAAASSSNATAGRRPNSSKPCPRRNPGPQGKWIGNWYKNFTFVH
jgi:hypothetical protein